MKNRKTKYIIIVLILVVSFFCISNTSFFKKSLISFSLQKKYQEKFKILSLKKTGSFLNYYYSATAYSLDYPDLVFNVTLDNESVQDSYVEKRLCYQVSDAISENLDSLTDEYYVYTEAMFTDSSLTNFSISLEDYFKLEANNLFRIYLFINLNQDTSQDITTAVNKMLNGMPSFDGSIALYFTDSNELVQIKEYLSTHDRCYYEFKQLTERSYVGSISFENSHVSLTEFTLENMASGRL